MKELSESQVLNKLATYCSKAERCEFDIKRKLDQWSFNDETAIRNILDRLYSEKFLNEERYCKSYIKDKIQYNKWGINKISYELKKKNISEEHLNSYLNDFSEDLYEEQLMKVLSSKIKLIKYKDKYDLKNKLMRFALGKGYSYDLTKKCLSNFL